MVEGAVGSVLAVTFAGPVCTDWFLWTDWVFAIDKPDRRTRSLFRRMVELAAFTEFAHARIDEKRAVWLSWPNRVLPVHERRRRRFTRTTPPVRIGESRRATRLCRCVCRHIHCQHLRRRFPCRLLGEKVEVVRPPVVAPMSLPLLHGCRRISC